jgi:hypothetical protein
MINPHPPSPKGYRFVNCPLPGHGGPGWREIGLFIPNDLDTRDVEFLRQYVDLLMMVAEPASTAPDAGGETG